MLPEVCVEVGGRRCHLICSEAAPEALVVKPLGPFEWRCLEEECRLTAERTDVPFVMAAFDMEDFDSFRQPDHGTLSYLKNELVPFLKGRFGQLPIVLGGYSLGGLFALWASTLWEGLDAVAAGSPSLWADWWGDYADDHPSLARYVYLSVGDAEDHTRKMPFALMGQVLRRQHERNLASHGEERCLLQIHPGGHFADIEQRKAQAWAWCLKALKADVGLDNGKIGLG